MMIKSNLSKRCLNIQHRRPRVGAVKWFNPAEIVGFDIFPELAAVALNRKRRCAFHVLEKHVENIADLVDEFVEIIIERSVIGGDDRKLGVVSREIRNARNAQS